MTSTLPDDSGSGRPDRESSASRSSGRPGAAGFELAKLYAHFTSRAEVVDAAMSRDLDRGNEVLDAVGLTGDPLLARERYIDAGWHLVDQAQALLVAAQRELPAGRIR
ncbi:hypothetical protein [Actinacidiphila glaucinigra]|nr:hypothetical protein [Actinacidiphila glaucinigra]